MVPPHIMLISVPFGTALSASFRLAAHPAMAVAGPAQNADVGKVSTNVSGRNIGIPPVSATTLVDTVNQMRRLCSVSLPKLRLVMRRCFLYVLPHAHESEGSELEREASC